MSGMVLQTNTYENTKKYNPTNTVGDDLQTRMKNRNYEDPNYIVLWVESAVQISFIIDVFCM